MLSLILPTFNEAKNLPELLPKLEEVLKGIPHEIIIVDDDSPDETWRIAQEIGHDIDDIHVIRRVGRRGLSSAVIEGFLSAKGEVLAVMDADGQHDMSVLPRIYESVMRKNGMVIGSRYIEGGSVGEWDERRHLMSRVATSLALKVCRVKVKDPMSGFFAIRRELFHSTAKQLNPKGFKILLDLLVCVPKETLVEEIPFTFSTRLHGESKLSRRVQIEFLEYLYDVTVGRYIPLTFVKYCIVGALGVVVHVSAYLAFSAVIREGGDLTVMGFGLAVIGATEVAIVFNFLLNNAWTFAHARLKGLSAFIGFLKFNGACLFGALANYAVSSYLFTLAWPELSAVIIGAFTGVVWNYTMSKMFAWKD
jgi:dolichol-phosphate mannosyltransferase